MSKPRTSRWFAFVAGLVGYAAAPALADQSNIICEVSEDYGITWHPTLSVWPGQRVDVRVRVQRIDPMPHTSAGLSGLTYQPTLTNWFPAVGDSHVPFDFPGLSNDGTNTTESAYAGRPVADGVGVTGRIFPLAWGSQSINSTSGLITAFHDPGDVLRFSGSRNTTLSTNFAWGVATAQPNAGLGGTLFNTSIDVVVFKYAVRLAPRTTSSRDLIASVPFASVSGGIVKWYICSNCMTALNLPLLPEHIFPATASVRSRCPADIAGTAIHDPRLPSAPPAILPMAPPT
jgi:hypothetical protein